MGEPLRGSTFSPSIPGVSFVAHDTPGYSRETPPGFKSRTHFSSHPPRVCAELVTCSVRADLHSLAPHVRLPTFRPQSRAGTRSAHDRGAAAHPRRRGHGKDAGHHRARGVSHRAGCGPGADPRGHFHKPGGEGNARATGEAGDDVHLSRTLRAGAAAGHRQAGLQTKLQHLRRGRHDEVHSAGLSRKTWR